MFIFRRDTGTRRGRQKQDSATSWDVHIGSHLQRDPRNSPILSSHYPECRCELLLECTPDSPDVESVRRDQINGLQEVRERQHFPTYLRRCGGTIPAVADADYYRFTKHRRSWRTQHPQF
jgi:hypothetical protein